MRKIKCGICALTVALTSTVAAANDNDKVNIWNWSDYIGENTVADFSKPRGLTPTM